jgi:proteasome component ECM29
MASRGLAAVYDMADEATRKALLDSLMATLSGGRRRHDAPPQPLLPPLWSAATVLGSPSGLALALPCRGALAHGCASPVAADASPAAPPPPLPAGAPQKRRAVKLSEESALFEPGALGSAPGGGSLTTYKELCSLATELGQPDLVYRFMELANSQAALNSSRGAAFG